MAYREIMKQFVNPYHFVSLGEMVSRKDYFEYEGEYTGILICELTTKTPFMIPDHETVKVDEKKHKEFEFFKIGDKPTIPGSEIRGVIRSAYEAVTNSCMLTTENKSLTSRTPSVKKSGILEYRNNQWKLYQAERYLIRTYEPLAAYPLKKEQSGNQYIEVNGKHYQTGDKISFDEDNFYDSKRTFIGKMAANLGNGKKDGVLLLGEVGEKQKKHHSHIFIKKEQIVSSNIQEAIENLKENLKYYRDPQLNRSHDGYLGYKLKMDGSQIPVFYEEVQGILYLAPASISRNVYHTKLHDLLKEQKPCEKRNALCEACGVFGMVGAEAIGSKLRFGDANLKEDQKDIWMPPVTLKELASPKISAVEFYTKDIRSSSNNKVRVWNYDYKTMTVPGKSAIDYASFRKDELKIRGRKFYWHHNKMDKKESKRFYATEEKTERNVTVTPLRDKVSFTFPVYFDHISKKTLHQLVWVLSLGKVKVYPNGKSSVRFHKLGMAKPLGFGSVQIEVTSLRQRSLDENGTYSITYLNLDEFLELPEQWKTKLYLKEFLKLTNFNTIQDGFLLAYPIGSDGGKTENSNASHQWFVGNRQVEGSDGRGTKPAFTYVLPDIPMESSSIPALPALEKRKENKK